MPLYEYLCADCHQTQEILVRSPDAQVECPSCGGKHLEKQISVPAAPAFAEGGRRSLPVANQSCGMPRCCGGGCQLD